MDHNVDSEAGSRFVADVFCNVVMGFSHFFPAQTPQAHAGLLFTLSERNHSTSIRSL